MSWFKRILDRLVTDKDEEGEEAFDQNGEHANATVETEEKERPTFRFPIITDAEIYGWDEDEENTQITKTKNVSEKTIDEFETVPLYQNERWPGKDVPTNIHRAGKKQKEKNITVETETNDYPIEQKSSIKGTRGFSPTHVPSPIYGFANRKPAVGFKKEVEVVKEETKFTLQNTDVPTIKDELAFLDSYRESILEPEAMVKELHEEETNQVKEETEFISEPVKPVEDNFTLQKSAVATLVDEQHQESTRESGEIEEEENFINNEKDDVVKEETEIFKEGIKYKSEPVELLEDKLSLEKPDVSAIEEQQLNLDSYQESILDPEVVEEKTTEQEIIIDKEPEPVIDSNDDIEPEPEVIEKKRERIVPFNVLMLKSDKAKLSTKQPVQINKQPEVTIEKVVEKPEVVEKEIIDHQENSTEEHYVFPSSELLIAPELQIEDTEWLESQSGKLEESLSHFGVKATVIDAVQGPTVTRFELTVGQGTKVSRVRNLTDDLKLTLAAKEIRIQAPIPGKSSIGIEIPNRNTRPVRISEVINSEEFRTSTSPLEAVLGLGLTGEPVTLDLRKMPHGLIAGATGSGKSVCINSLLVSLLYKATPSDLKMMLIDPKMVELAPFNGIPHLISPVITDVKAATAALKWAVAEMERRYELLAHMGVRDIERYNKVVEENKQYSLKMPYLLIVIDELSDLMMMSPADVEVSIIRIAQKARACGIHLIIATQRPSVDVITGTIKANIPTRIAFSVSSQVDSRTIIDTIGAERLLGKGDMLYLGNGQSASVRLQGTFVTDDEIERIIEHVQREAKPEYLFGQEELLKTAVEEEDNDPLFEEACLFIYEQGSASTSLLQRNFSIGYNRAARLMDSIEKHGFISEQRGSRARDVFITENDLERLSDVTSY
ncbi:DNA translocase FtsK [Sporosarcina sp. Marseille-Q4063]|uniref:DNA translocase FtsK n=1 Tax=Sporosarcina sp. Marseille-Q4063 TaxID=2810514 RepID=UPI001BAF9843|nr:DNA translocase FtsK [Sporosarcina sp. Marseille-Q4063]QUW22742.1 DNA translocase FtsK [Sporosarcina sp. Marseille-Q4063]